MIERQEMLAREEGPMPTLVVASAQPRAAIVMLTDGRGFRPAYQELARKLGAEGYYVLVPNLYYRHAGDGRPTEDIDDPDWMATLNAALTPDKAAADVVACLAFAANDRAGPSGRVAGLIGFCMGARLAVGTAQLLGDRVGAVVALHPGYMATTREDSPHRHLDRITAEIYFGIAEHDPHLSAGAVGRLRDALEANRVNYRLEVLEGTQHGYAVPGRDLYHPQQAAHAWSQGVELFGRRLDA